MDGLGYEYRASDHGLSHTYLFDNRQSTASGCARGIDGARPGMRKRNVLSLFHSRRWKRFGTDFSPTGIAIAQKTYPDVHFFLADAESAEREILQQTGKVDAILSTEVIEHVYAPRAFLHTAFAVLKPGGLLVLTTPYHGYWKNLMLALTGKLDSHFTVLWDHGHIKFWSRKTLTEAATETGFRVLKFEGSGRFPYLWKSMALLLQRPTLTDDSKAT